jgi:hypothetical protein
MLGAGLSVRDNKLGGRLVCLEDRKPLLRGLFSYVAYQLPNSSNRVVFPEIHLASLCCYVVHECIIH